MALRHHGGTALSSLVRLLPRRLRFRAALRLAAAAAPLLRNHPIVRARLAMRVETAREIVTYHLLDILTRHGVAFDPLWRAEGLECCEAALASGRGVLFVGPHTMLSTVALRPLRELGRELAVVATGDVPIPGTPDTARAIVPSFTYFLEVRRLLMANGILVAMIDRAEVNGRTSVEVATAQGPVIIADALIRLAVRTETAVMFIAARLSGGEIVMKYAAAGASTVEGIAAAFMEFLRGHVAAVAGER
ncbi:MAG TPA: hypothetical protein VF618_10800 [Thermoanaerobaculia bacterium]